MGIETVKGWEYANKKERMGIQTEKIVCMPMRRGIATLLLHYRKKFLHISCR